MFGWWNQKTMSIKKPLLVGTAMTITGQGLYGVLPLFDSNQKWIMMVARVITGFGAGTLSVLRAYAATASVPRDRLRAVSLGTAGFVLGLSFGPALQAAFTPIGPVGLHMGSIVLNMYTVPAFFMVVVSMVGCVVIVTLFEEDYAGIIDKK
ncbi:MFS domain-containing protein, partial [Trichostrongylus colubriformis]